MLQATLRVHEVWMNMSREEAYSKWWLIKRVHAHTVLIFPFYKLISVAPYITVRFSSGPFNVWSTVGCCCHHPLQLFISPHLHLSCSAFQHHCTAPVWWNTVPVPCQPEKLGSPLSESSYSASRLYLSFICPLCSPLMFLMLLTLCFPHFLFALLYFFGFLVSCFVNATAKSMFTSCSLCLPLCLFSSLTLDR